QYSTSPSYFFFHHPPTTAIYTLSLHDALPICARFINNTIWRSRFGGLLLRRSRYSGTAPTDTVVVNNILSGYGEIEGAGTADRRSEEHTSELQSRGHLVCRLLLEKKKKTDKEG